MLWAWPCRISISRYYIPDLHTRIRYQDALRWFRFKQWLDTATAFHSNVCDCDVCQKTLAGNPDKFELFGHANVKNVVRRGGIARTAFPIKEAQQRCLTHYLQRKAREYAAASEAPQDVLLANLHNGYEKYRLVAGLEGVAHLRKWHNVFVKILGEASF